MRMIIHESRGKKMININDPQIKNLIEEKFAKVVSPEEMIKKYHETLHEKYSLQETLDEIEKYCRQSFISSHGTYFDLGARECADNILHILKRDGRK